jgi:hypothetical protein
VEEEEAAAAEIETVATIEDLVAAVEGEINLNSNFFNYFR